MKRRSFALLPLALPFGARTASRIGSRLASHFGFPLASLAMPDALGADAATASAPAYEPVVPGKVLRFPDDEGSHPGFRLEWWYVTGWLSDETSRPLGFQVTFFRTRPVATAGNPSRFAPAQLFVAHAALSDPQRGRVVHDQRIARGVFGLAWAGEGATDVAIGDWRLAADGDALRANVKGRELALELAFRRPQPPLLHGDQGMSRKGPAEESASYYYSLPHLAVEGTVASGKNRSRVTGTAWLDHEWSTAYMEQPATGWDWIGINLNDGGALMVFRMRSPTRVNFWGGATLRTADGRTRTFSPQQIAWLPVREWRSTRSGATYRVEWRVRVDELVLQIVPLIDDQELDARASTGTVYWEGAVTAQVDGREVGRGYLEMTGYWRAFRP
jgi:predicted secreted hydrolase